MSNIHTVRTLPAMVLIDEILQNFLMVVVGEISTEFEISLLMQFYERVRRAYLMFDHVNLHLSLFTSHNDVCMHNKDH